MKRLWIAVMLCGTGAGCGVTEPTAGLDREPATGIYAPDLAQVTQQIVDELRAAGLDVVASDRLPGPPFSVGAQRINLRFVPHEQIRVYVYRTAELAAAEASRITPDGNVRPEPGVPFSIAEWITTQRYYYRDRVILAYSGCDATSVAGVEQRFGQPVVVTRHGCRPAPAASRVAR